MPEVLVHFPLEASTLDKPEGSRTTEPNSVPWKISIDLNSFQ